MNYKNIVKAIFIKRENRFAAWVNIDGDEVRVHVKNTGRCRELLISGCTVYLEDFSGRMRNRKMRYSLIAVAKERGNKTPLLINMDSQAPNKAVYEALKELSDDAAECSRLTLPDMEKAPMVIKPERKFGESRLDFYLETRGKDGRGSEGAFVEVKGVTLEENGIARFPDAPTERGLKHIKELIKAVQKGYKAYIIFVVQMKEIYVLKPNYETHPEFGEALKRAANEGVHVIAYDCKVTPNSLVIDEPVEVELSQA